MTTDTPISLLKIILAEVEDECTCDQARDRCLHCRIERVLEADSKAEQERQSYYGRIQALQRELATAERVAIEYHDRLRDARLI